MEIKDHYYKFREQVDTVLRITYNWPMSKLSWVKEINISQSPVAFFNKCNIYFDNSSLPPICSNITDLSNKYVLYGIYCCDKFYIGKTKDFGERLSTHIKDSRNSNSSQQLYKDMIKQGECLAFIFCVADDEKTFNDMEHTIINKCKQFSIDMACNFDKQKIKFIKESIGDTKEYALKYCYNIVN